MSIVFTKTQKPTTRLVLTPKTQKKNGPKKRQKRGKRKKKIQQVDPRWLRIYGYDKKRLESKKKRIEEWEKENPGQTKKKRKTTHKTIHKRRHEYFTTGKGRHGIHLVPARVQRQTKRLLKENQEEMKEYCSFETNEQDEILPFKVSPEYMESQVAHLDALYEKILKRAAAFAAHRQRGRKKTANEKNPSYMLKKIDIIEAWDTILDDAKRV